MTQTNQSTETSARNNGKAKLPTHVAKVRHGYGKKATYERIGVAWRNDDGSLYVKLAGTQMVSALTLYELEDKSDAAADEAAPVDDGGADEEAGEEPPPRAASQTARRGPKGPRSFSLAGPGRCSHNRGRRK